MSNFGVYPPASGREVRAQLKVLIADITLTNPGSFEAVPIPAGFDHLEVWTSLRSTAAVTADGVYLLMNTDATAANYRTQSLTATSTTLAGAATDTPLIAIATGASSPSGYYGDALITVFQVSKSDRYTTAVSAHYDRRDASNTDVRVQGYQWESTEPIINITLRTDNHATDLFAAGSRVQVFGLGTFALALAR